MRFDLKSLLHIGKENVEKVVFWVLAATLVFMPLRLIDILIGGPVPGEVAATALKGRPERALIAKRQELTEKKVRFLLGLLIPRAFSHYQPVCQRDPFAELPPFQAVPTAVINEKVRVPKEFKWKCLRTRYEEGGWKAVLQHLDTGEERQVVRGEDVEGWKVRWVARTRVFLLSEEGESAILRVEHPSPPPPNFKLMGITTFPDKTRMAMIEDKTAGKTYNMRKGDSIGNWKVVDILDNIVILGKDGEGMELRLRGR